MTDQQLDAELTGRKRPRAWRAFSAGAPRYFRWLWRAEWALRWLLFSVRNMALVRLFEVGAIFSVPIAVTAYILGNGDRARERLYRAAEVLARPPGTIADAARRAALEDLAANHIPLQGVRLPDSTFLWGIDLRGAVLTRSELRHNLLAFANLSCRRSIMPWAERCVIAEFADWRGIRLLGDARGIDLWLADLEGAMLLGTNLTGAQLYGVHLTQADLQRATLRSAYVDKAVFTLADLRHADLRDLQAWHGIRDMRFANLAGVKDAPPGFLRWAVDTMGAVVMDDSNWVVLLRDSMALSTARASAAVWCSGRPSVACGAR